MEPKMKRPDPQPKELLIKLINRQCGMTGYELVQAFLGGFKAWTWQVFARITGASLKATYRPQTDPDDALTERIVRLYDQRIL